MKIQNYQNILGIIRGMGLGRTDLKIKINSIPFSFFVSFIIYCKNLGM